MAEWWDELEDAGPAFRDLMGEFGEEGLGPPDTWDRYEVHIHDSGLVEGIIYDDEGNVFSTEAQVDFDTESFQWAWDIWEWIDEHPEYDIDEEAFYEE